MIVILITFLLAMGILLAGRRESLKEVPVKERWKRPFYRGAIYLIRRFGMQGQFSVAKKDQILADMKALSPGKRMEKKVYSYYVNKISLVLMIVLIGNVFAAGVYLCNRMNMRLADGAQISRNTWGAGSFSIQLQAAGEEKQKEDFAVVIEEQQLTADQAGQLIPEVIERLPELIKGSNEALDQVTGNLNLVRKIKGYPFAVSWESSNLKLLKPDGQVVNENVAEIGEVVKLTAHFSYQDARWEHEMHAHILPPVLSEREKWKGVVLQAVEANAKESTYLQLFPLPVEIQGETITWKEKTQNNSFYLWLATLAAAAAVFAGQDRELHNKAQKRSTQLQRSYHEFINKLTLYIGAGMTSKNAWKRIAFDYQEQRKSGKVIFLYEEMLVSCYEFDNGVAEGEVYTRFGRRTGRSEYQKLAGILCNNLQKGNSNLLRVLKEEADQALAERKNIAKALGEEAGTKLLFPMVLMLSLVMVMIMIPAYFMF